MNAVFSQIKLTFNRPPERLDPCYRFLPNLIRKLLVSINVMLVQFSLLARAAEAVWSKILLTRLVFWGYNFKIKSQGQQPEDVLKIALS